jgi:hypothetical protein
VVGCGDSEDLNMGGVFRWATIAAGVMAVLMVLGGCSLFEEDGESNCRSMQANLRESMEGRNWKEVEAELSYGWCMTPSEVWEEISVAARKQRFNEAGTRGLLGAIAGAGVPFDEKETMRFLRQADVRPEWTPETFWKRMPIEARRMWVMREMAREAGRSIARGVAAGKGARMAALAKLLAGMDGVKKNSIGVTAKIWGGASQGMSEPRRMWDDYSTYVFGMGGGWLVVYTGADDDLQRLEGAGRVGQEGRQSSHVLVVIREDGTPEAFGVAAPDDFRFDGRMAPVGMVRLNMPGQKAEGIDALVLGWGEVYDLGVNKMSDPVAHSAAVVLKRESSGGKSDRISVDDSYFDLSRTLIYPGSFPARVLAGNPEYGTLRLEYPRAVQPRHPFEPGLRALPVYWQEQVGGKVELRARTAGKLAGEVTREEK